MQKYKNGNLLDEKRDDKNNKRKLFNSIKSIKIDIPKANKKENLNKMYVLYYNSNISFYNYFILILY